MPPSEDFFDDDLDFDDLDALEADAIQRLANNTNGTNGNGNQNGNVVAGPSNWRTNSNNGGGGAGSGGAALFPSSSQASQIRTVAKKKWDPNRISELQRTSGGNNKGKGKANRNGSGNGRKRSSGFTFDGDGDGFEDEEDISLSLDAEPELYPPLPANASGNPLPSYDPSLPPKHPPNTLTSQTILYPRHPKFPLDWGKLLLLLLLC